MTRHVKVSGSKAFDLERNMQIRWATEKEEKERPTSTLLETARLDQISLLKKTGVNQDVAERLSERSADDVLYLYKELATSDSEEKVTTTERTVKSWRDVAERIGKTWEQRTWERFVELLNQGISMEEAFDQTFHPKGKV